MTQIKKSADMVFLFDGIFINLYFDSDRISARLEYRYSDLGGSDAKFQQHQALVGVAYHF